MYFRVMFNSLIRKLRNDISNLSLRPAIKQLNFLKCYFANLQNNTLDCIKYDRSIADCITKYIKSGDYRITLLSRSIIALMDLGSNDVINNTDETAERTTASRHMFISP